MYNVHCTKIQINTNNRATPFIVYGKRDHPDWLFSENLSVSLRIAVQLKDSFCSLEKPYKLFLASVAEKIAWGGFSVFNTFLWTWALAEVPLPGPATDWWVIFVNRTRQTTWQKLPWLPFELFDGSRSPWPKPVSKASGLLNHCLLCLSV